MDNDTSSIIGLIVWFFAGLTSKGSVNTKQINKLLNELDGIYNINIWVWVPLLVIIICLVCNVSTVPSMLASSLSAVIIGTLNNHFNIVDGFKAMFNGFTPAMTGQSNLSTNATSLLEQGGMMSMTEILVTIFCGYAFAGIVEVSGCLDVMLKRFLRYTFSWNTYFNNSHLLFNVSICSWSSIYSNYYGGCLNERHVC